MPQDVIAPIFAAGFAFGALSLVSIGPNNLLLMREGMARGRPVLVASVMWGCYAACLGLAVFAGHFVHPMIEQVAWILGWAGALVLAAMGVAALRASARKGPDLAVGSHAPENRSTAARRVLRVVWLNPLTYLELLAIPAALALPLGGLEQRFALFAGLLLAFALNCYGFSLGATLLAPLFGKPSRIRIFDGVSGACMICLAVIAAMTASAPHRADVGGQAAFFTVAQAMTSPFSDAQPGR